MYLMASTMVHVRMEQKLKKDATRALAAMGLSVSDVVRMVLTRVAAEQALPFEVRVPNTKTVTSMKEARRGGLRSQPTASALLADLSEDD
jgi:DNA-damage-inducible protein J